MERVASLLHHYVYRIHITPSEGDLPSLMRQKAVLSHESSGDLMEPAQDQGL